MTVGSRLGALAAAVLALVLVVALLADLRATQRSLHQQLEARNHDAVAVLAAALANPGQDRAAWQAVANAQFRAGQTVLLRMQSDDRKVSLRLQRPATPAKAPDWFVRALPLDAAPVVSVLGESDRPAGVLELQTDPAWAYDALWGSFTRALGATAVLTALVLTLALWARRHRAPRWAGQAPPPAGGIAAPAPGRPPPATAAESREVSDLRQAFASQAERVVLLQRQAQLDEVTGLPLRRHFLGLLQQRLDEPGGPGTALLLVRVLHLQALNQRLGHACTDQLLGAVAQVLLTYVDRAPGILAGRLNGTDFALCLPVAGMASETAASLRTALAAVPALRRGGAEAVVGGVDGVHESSAGAALAAADAALARAEAALDDDAAAIVQHASLQDELLGAHAWRERMAAALAEGRTQLAEVAVLDAQGCELHLECPLRVQLQAGGEFQAADRWLALARRSRLLPQVDLAAIELALRAIADDGRARAVPVSVVALATPGFVTDVLASLAAAPRAAQQLTLECADSLRRSTALAPLAAAMPAWKPWGVQVGVAGAAAAAQHLPALRAAGVHYVKVDARHLLGLDQDAAIRDYAQGFVQLAHGLGLKVLATGLSASTPLDALWAVGFDGASRGGPVPQAAVAV